RSVAVARHARRRARRPRTHAPRRAAPPVPVAPLRRADARRHRPHVRDLPSARVAPGERARSGTAVVDLTARHVAGAPGAPYRRSDSTTRGAPTMTDQNDAVVVDGYAEMQTETLLNLASPQPMYRDMIEQGGIAAPADGVVMVFNRELSDYVLR